MKFKIKCSWYPQKKLLQTKLIFRKDVSQSYLCIRGDKKGEKKKEDERKADRILNAKAIWIIGGEWYEFCRKFKSIWGHSGGTRVWKQGLNREIDLEGRNHIFIYWTYCSLILRLDCFLTSSFPVFPFLSFLFFIFFILSLYIFLVFSITM